MVEINLSAHCPRCGKEVPAIFELLPDASKTLQSIACRTCHQKNRPDRNQPIVAREVDMAATVAADSQVTTHVLQAPCGNCSSLVYKSWRFCPTCGREAVRPS